MHCSLQGYSLSFIAEIIKISFHRDLSGLGCLLLRFVVCRSFSRIVGVHMVLLGVDLGFGGRVFSSLCSMSLVAGGDINVCRRSPRQGNQDKQKLLLWPKLRWGNCAIPS